MEKIIFTGDPPKKEIFQIFVETMGELIEADPAVTYLDADLMASMRSKELWQKYPDNVFNTGIQEANMIGVAAGMSLYGRKPYVHSFAPFAVRRCFDQVYVSIGFARKSIRIIGSEPGLCATDNGGTHMTFEDIAIMRTLPNATIFDISDGGMFRSFLAKSKDMDGVVYFRTPRRGLPDIYAEGTAFEAGHGKVLREGTDCTLIASGIMVATALQAAQALAEQGLYVTVVDPVTIKPLDENLILQCARKTGNVVTIENHSIHGGLGGAVAEFLSERGPSRIKRLGVSDRFGEVGTEAYLRGQFRLDVTSVVEDIRAFVGERKDG